MVQIFQSTILLLSLFASFVLSRHGCRQCSGNVELKFDTAVSADIALNYFHSKFDACATGKLLEIQDTQRSDCTQYCKEYVGKTCGLLGDTTTCKTVMYTVQAWRYCGNGGLANFSKDEAVNVPGYKGNCNYLLNLGCSHSVKCGSDCNCADCGC